jgi:hypothetical protein
VLKTYVVSVFFQVFRMFQRYVLHLFQMNVAKVDQNVAYVAMVAHVCYKGLFPMFHLCFWTYCCKCVYLNVAYVLHICCRCFICILHVFAMVFKLLSCIFASVSETCFKCYIYLQTYVASVASGYFKSR